MPVNAEELRSLQSPLKDRYRKDPASAVITQRARGRVNQDTISFVLETGKPGVPAGLHPATGGDGSAACSSEMLLEALASCAGVTLAAVATSMGIELGEASITAEGDLDFRGTLGVAKDVPVGFSRMRLKFSIKSSAGADKIRKLVELTERYCVVFQTLAHPPSIEIEA
jgi:uncharacterized OsmC-like protein